MKEKKGKYYSIICFLIAITIFVNGIPVSAVNSREVADRLDQIAQKYPDASFFSVNGQACTHAHNLTCDNCALLNIYPELKGKVSNAWTCCSFARYIYYELFHVNSYSISLNSKEVPLSDAKAGDMVMFYSGSSITHYAIFLNADSANGKYYLYESNYIVSNKVRYNGAYSATQLANVKIWHANNYDAVANADADTDTDIVGNVPEGSLGTAGPTATPSPTQMPTPSALPTPAPTTAPLPTNKPSPMSTSTPTPTPTPTPISDSNPIPAPNPDPKPKLTPTPTSKPISLLVPSPNPELIGQPSTGKNTQIPVINIKINKTKLELGKGKLYKLNATITPQRASNKKVIWLSGNQKIATVSSVGIVKGIKKGITYIYAISSDGKKETKCMVIVN